MVTKQTSLKRGIKISHLEKPEGSCYVWEVRENVAGTASNRWMSRWGRQFDGKQAAAGTAEARMRWDVFGVLEKDNCQPDGIYKQDRAVRYL